jgi:O-antigen/teichoic acid export membrane protein
VSPILTETVPKIITSESFDDNITMAEPIKTIERLAFGSLINIITLGCNILVSFYMIPFLVHSLGDRWYGFWSLVGTFIGYYGFLDFGLTSAVSRFISRAYGKNDHNEMNIVINTSMIIFGILGLITFVLSIGAAIVCSFFLQDEQEVIIFRIVILLLGFSVSIGFPMRAFAGILTAKIRYDLLSCLDLTKLFLRSTLIVFFIKAGYGLVALAVITVSVDLFGHALNIWFVNSVFKKIKISINNFRKNRIRTLLNYSKYSFLNDLADILKTKLGTVIIAAFLNLSLVTYYFLATRLIEYFTELIVSTLGTMVPVYSKMEGRNDYNSIRRWLFTSTKISVFVSFFVGLSIMFYGQSFIFRWIGPEYNDTFKVLIILCTASIFDLMQVPGTGVLFGISKHKFYAYANCIETFLSVVLSIILVNLYGIYGAAMGSAIGMVLLKLFVQPIYTCHIINISLIDYYFKTILWTATKLVLPLLIYFYIIKDMLQANYLNIFLLGILQIILIVPITLCIIFGKDEKKMAIDMVRSNLGRFSLNK